MLGTKQIILTTVGATTIIGGGAGVYLLSQDKTIEHKLVREGVKLINSTDEYEVAFMEKRSNKELITTIGGVTADSNAQEGGKALEKWCENNLKMDLSEQNIKNIFPKAKDYCAKPSTTIEERYKKLGKRLVEDSKWKDHYGTLKSSNSNLNKDLELGEFTGDTDNMKAGQALKTWCNTKIKTQLVKDKDDSIWKKVEKHCFQNQDS